MPKRMLGRERRTNPLIWFAAIICAFLAVAVIITGLAVFIIYMIYQPKMPDISVTEAQLLRLDYVQTGQFDVQMSLKMEVKNENTKAHAKFYDFDFLLRFHRMTIAELRADPFDVEKNSSYPLNYLVESNSILLDQGGMAEMDASLKKGKIAFSLNGQAMTNWRVGVFASVKLWSHLNCQLLFSPTNGTSIGLDCSSKSG